ncbi:MAG: cysteine hydrolase [Candidatus Pacebacteria bacterium]|nr:cysteine hydrolase [Candidatus Paceibacterota bacterium]
MEENKTILDLWDKINATIRKMGRQDRLFKINPAKTALIVVDMQDGFCSPTGCLENPGTKEIVDNINTLSSRCRTKGIPVIWIKFQIKNDQSNSGLWPLFQPASPYVGRKSPIKEFSDKGSETGIWPKLSVDSEKDIEIVKNKYSAFIPGSSDSDKVLKARGIDTLVITGVGTNVCCESTARDAMMLNYKVIFISDANATIGKIFHEITLMNIKMFFGDVATTKEIVKEL